MNRKITGYISLTIIVLFIVYIIYDTMTQRDPESSSAVSTDVIVSAVEDKWHLTDSISSAFGNLNAVSVTADGKLIIAGESFIASYDKDKKLIWSMKTILPVTSLCVSGDTVFASTRETLYLVWDAKIIDEYGPYDEGSIFTGIASNRSYLALADAGNKLVFIVSKSGELKKIIGRSGKRFIIPSPYFDVALTSDNKLVAANTGERKVEIRTFDDEIIGIFGESGTLPGSFCGCCNPAHFALFRDGLITAEKGINRIKMMSTEGKFMGFVSSVNKFRSSVPLDIAVSENGTVYAANPVNSLVYKFEKN